MSVGTKPQVKEEILALLAEATVFSISSKFDDRRSLVWMGVGHSAKEQRRIFLDQQIEDLLMLILSIVK
jgi:hypothetical protein